MKRILRIAFVFGLALGAAGSMAYIIADDRVEISSEECQARPVEGGISLSATSRTGFDIYSITGQKVKSVTVESGSVKAELPKGCYVVRCPQWSKKVVVK